MAELWAMSACELARLVRAREVSAREVVEAHLDRIGQVNPALNAVTVLLAADALRAAGETDAALRRDGVAPPLCGVPMTVKENIDVAGSATTLGITALRDAVAERDSPHIGELRAAGAIPVGRANMPEFGMRWHTANALRGATRNPWSAGHTPGGSSGGDAAAVASGMAPLGMGNDGAGSLRWPAACCGVAALKPSLGRVPQGGGHQPAPFGFQLLAVHGPIARHVADLRLAFRHMCGRQGGDPWYAPVPLEGPAVAPPIRVRVVTDPGRPGAPADPAVAGALSRAAAFLAGAGYLVEEGQPPALDRAGEIYHQIMSAWGRAQEEQPPVETVAPGDFARFWALFEPAWTAAAGRATFDPMMERHAIARAWHAWMEQAPLVLAPVCARQPFETGADLDPRWLAGWPSALRMTVAVNLLGLPAVTVPVGTDDGLPQAVQVIGPRFREDICLDAAAVIEAGTGPLTPIDPRGDGQLAEAMPVHLLRYSAFADSLADERALGYVGLTLRCSPLTAASTSGGHITAQRKAASMTTNARSRKPAPRWYYVLPEVAAPLGGGLIKLGQGGTWAAVSVGLAPYVILATLYALFVIGYIPAVICYLCCGQDRQEAVDRLITTSANAIVSLLTLTPANGRAGHAVRNDAPGLRS